MNFRRYWLIRGLVGLTFHADPARAIVCVGLGRSRPPDHLPDCLPGAQRQSTG